MPLGSGWARSGRRASAAVRSGRGRDRGVIQPGREHHLQDGVGAESPGDRGGVRGHEIMRMITVMGALCIGLRILGMSLGVMRFVLARVLLGVLRLVFRRRSMIPRQMHDHPAGGRLRR